MTLGPEGGDRVRLPSHATLHRVRPMTAAERNGEREVALIVTVVKLCAGEWAGEWNGIHLISSLSIIPLLFPSIDLPICFPRTEVCVCRGESSLINAAHPLPLSSSFQ